MTHDDSSRADCVYQPGMDLYFHQIKYNDIAEQPVALSASFDRYPTISSAFLNVIILIIP